MYKSKVYQVSYEDDLLGVFFEKLTLFNKEFGLKAMYAVLNPDAVNDMCVFIDPATGRKIFIGTNITEKKINFELDPNEFFNIIGEVDHAYGVGHPDDNNHCVYVCYDDSLASGSLLLIYKDEGDDSEIYPDGTDAGYLLPKFFVPFNLLC